MKKWIGVLLILGVLMMGGCSKSSSDTDTETATSEITITGTVSAIGVSAQATITSYMIMFQNQVTNRVAFAKIASDGSFSFDSANTQDSSLTTVDHTSGLGDEFMVMILNTDPLEMAAVAYLGQSDTEGHTGLALSKSVSSALELNFDATTSKLTFSSDNINALEGVLMNSDLLVRLKADQTGVPVGMDDFGKSVDSKTTAPSIINRLDPDQDGRPNIFDGMNDGQKLDNLDITNKTESAMTVLSGSVSHSSMFMNLKIDYEQSSTFTVTDNAIVVLEVIPADASVISEIKVATLFGIRMVHANYKNAELERIPNGFTSAEYPTVSSSSPPLWSAHDYKLFKSTNLSDEIVYTVLIKPKNNDFEPGDLVLLEVTKTDGTKEYYFNSINFKFQTIPTDKTTWSHGGQGWKSNPFKTLDTGGYTFTWDDPLDETGAALTGLSYQFEVFYYGPDCDPVPTNQMGDMFIIDDRESGVTDKYDISEAEINRQNTTSGSTVTTPKCFQLDIAGSYPYGDNAALKYYIKRESW